MDVFRKLVKLIDEDSSLLTLDSLDIISAGLLNRVDRRIARCGRGKEYLLVAVQE
jgi:hypothetical protein